MLCPHCSASIRYRERSNQTCSSCYKVFAFEPKTHPLRLSDNYFSSSVNKLSNYDKLYFTPQQLQFAVSRKKMKSGGLFIFLIIFAIISTIIGCVILFNIVAQVFDDFKQEVIVIICLAIGISLIVFWIILIFAFKKYYKPIVSLPQSHVEFENSVLADWRGIYGKLPPKLVMNFKFRENFHDLKGILLCQTDDGAKCLAANQVDKNLGVAIMTKPPKASELLQKHGKLPIYVLHDASIDGIEFVEKIKQFIGNQTTVIDIGLRPQNLLKSNFPKMREKGFNANHLNDLTAEEKDWLNQGYYVPLYVLRPEKLIQFVQKHIQKKEQIIEQTADKRAKAVGFMTWVGQ